MEYKKSHLPNCNRCFGRAIVRDRKTQRWSLCHCGRIPRSTEQAKLDKQKELDHRLEDLKEGKPW